MKIRALKISAICMHVISQALVIAMVNAITSLPVQAVEVSGFELNGYMRGGAYSSSAGTPHGGYTLGGDTQKFRLGNEGDDYMELGIGKTFNFGEGMKWGMLYMPSVSNGKYSTIQAVAMMSGLDFAPEASFWAGQRRLRIQDVHIVDWYLMGYGDNTGAGMTDYNLGFAKLGAAVFTGGTFDNNTSAVNNASRINVDLSEIRANPGGTLRVLATLLRGNFQMGNPGYSLSVLHNQSDFLWSGLSNMVFLQGATGHASLSGQFQGLGDATTSSGEQPGLISKRVADAINWQSGPLGGQALVVYQTAKFDGGIYNAIATRDFTLGGRVSYATGKNFKLLVEAGTTSRNIDGQARQSLNKITLAPTLALAPDFWSRPELRFYITHARWNDAAAIANSRIGGFGIRGRTSNTIAGVQIEAWW